MPDDRHILLAEDDLVNQRVGTAMLESLGFVVDVVSDGAEAVRAASGRVHWAILMDCQLPVLDGYRATEEIRRLEAGSRRTPIIAVTASALPSDRRRCLAMGMDAILIKPLRLTALAAALTEWSSAPALVGPVVSGGALPVVTDPGPSVLDPVVVHRLQRLGEAAGEDLLGQLASLFLVSAETHITALQAALARDDPARVAWSAHALSGAGASLGASELARLCAALAAAGTSGDLAGGGAGLDAVEAELARVRSALAAPVLTA